MFNGQIRYFCGHFPVRKRNSLEDISHSHPILHLWQNPLAKPTLKLVGGFKPSEQYEFVNWDDGIPKSYGKIKKCSKPPTSFPFIVLT